MKKFRAKEILTLLLLLGSIIGLGLAMNQHRTAAIVSSMAMPITITATKGDDANYSKSVTAVYNLVNSLDVQLTSLPSYRMKDTLNPFVDIIALNQPQPGVLVTWIMTRPDGTTYAFTQTTTSSGVSSLSYKFDRKIDRIGVYTLQVNASKNGVKGASSAIFNLMR